MISVSSLVSAITQSPSLIRAELSADWNEDMLPEFSIVGLESAKLTVKSARPEEYSKTSGFYIEDETIHFHCSRAMVDLNCSENEAIYVAGAFNDWGEAIGKKRCLMTVFENNNEDGLWLSIPFKDLDLGNGAGFKFVTARGHWFSIPSEASNVYLDEHNNPNYFIDDTRSGSHLLDIECSIDLSISENYHLSMTWDDAGVPVGIVPGNHFLEMGSELALGAFPRKTNTLFRIFAPRASSVELILMDEPDGEEDGAIYDLVLLSDGVWEIVVDDNLTGKYYCYSIDGAGESRFSNFDPEFRILDPYALATVGHAGPGIVVDTSVYDEPVPFTPTSIENMVIGEVHIRDLIAKAEIEITAEDRLGYQGLTQWLRSELCYLKEWGINTIELQPIHENDAQSKEEYAWGYMPNNYFSPDSGYATDPVKATQVQEFKDLVDAFHEVGLTVILDVVYNHVGVPAHLMFLDKYYYFELKADGSLSNWSGCGNDLRCSTPMGKRLITDSLKHMLGFYGVDGFRFDLAELIGLNTLKEIETEIHSEYPEAILIAEPWSFRGHLGSDLQHTSYFTWNDGFREFLKSYVLGDGDVESLKYFFTGSHDQVDQPFRSINYTESHDDRTWLDEITMAKDHNGIHPTRHDRLRTHLMVATLMMCHGTPMLSAGQDFLRSKWGIKNTYQRGDVNALDYQRMIEYSATHDYFRRWIAFRLSEGGHLLRQANSTNASFYEFTETDPGNGLVVLLNADGSQGPDKLLFAINPNNFPVSFSIPAEWIEYYWIQVADRERFRKEGLTSAYILIGESIQLPATGCALWKTTES